MWRLVGVSVKLRGKLSLRGESSYNYASCMEYAPVSMVTVMRSAY